MLVACWYTAVLILLVGAVISLNDFPMTGMLILFLLTINRRAIFTKREDSAEAGKDPADIV